MTSINGAVGQWLSGGATSGSSASSASGASTSSGTDFIDLTNLTNLQVTAQVNEADIASVKLGNPVTFTVSALPNQTFAGKVSTIQPLGQTTSNVVAYTVTSTIDKSNASLLPGMTATESIVTNQVNDVVSVPTAALSFARGQISTGSAPATQAQTPGTQASQTRASGSATAVSQPAAAGSTTAKAATTTFEQPGGPGVLYVLRNGAPQAVQVQFGISNGTSVQVTSGLDAGAQVITGGGAAKTTTAKASTGGTSILGNTGGPGAGGPRPGA